MFLITGDVVIVKKPSASAGTRGGGRKSIADIGASEGALGDVDVNCLTWIFIDAIESGFGLFAIVRLVSIACYWGLMHDEGGCDPEPTRSLRLFEPILMTSS